jgi:hypothetical protein
MADTDLEFIAATSDLLGEIVERATSHLDWDARLALAEHLRDCADRIDRGIYERSHRRMKLVPKRLVRTDFTDEAGRPLFRLVR